MRLVLSGLLTGCLTLVALSSAAQSQSFSLSDCYARADAGYGWGDDDEAIAAITDFGSVFTGPVINPNLDDAWFGEIGLGCAIRHWRPSEDEHRGFRADVTVGYRDDRDFTGLATVPAATLPISITTSLQTWTALFNVYYDLGNFAGLTPYIGAGVGAAFHDVGTVRFTNGSTVLVRGKDETEFTWALMAGFTKEICDDLFLDVGYRYIDMGSVSASQTHGAGGGTCPTCPTCGCPQTFSLDLDDAAHEARVGLRIPLHRDPPAEPLK